ncbi:MAG: FliI/YscN family ATPase [Treponema sp.]|jgi:flagellum-specific ATP synthase|nr:FliI/YscN family ATPase [Treponema sp.]
METLFEKYLITAEKVEPIKCVGRIVKVQGLLIESLGPGAVIGEVCRIVAPRGRGSIQAEVVGLRGETVQLMAYEETGGIEVGNRVIASGTRLEVAVSNKLLGRVLNSRGKPADGKEEIDASVKYSAMASPPDPLKRRRITQRISTGVRAIDGLLAVGRGQRLGIFAGSGVGKSSLLGMIARNTSADVNVIALIGERGREVNDFIEKDLGSEGLARSVLVVATSDEPPLSRLRGAYVAAAVAESFRDQGLDVMLFFDSVTRFARAQREVGLAAGEPPATRGYTPSVFDSMPKLLERSGTAERGSITGFYTVLVDGDDMDEPISDTVRGILDGHVVLSRRLAARYHYPSIDILQSVSRLAPAVSGKASAQAAGVVRRNMAIYAESEDLINVGAYHAGSNPAIDEAIAKHQGIENFLVQELDERSSLEKTLSLLSEVSGVPIPEEEMAGRIPRMVFSGSPAEDSREPSAAGGFFKSYDKGPAGFAAGSAETSGGADAAAGAFAEGGVLSADTAAVP